MKLALIEKLLRRLELRFPVLVTILAVLTLVDVFVPDPVPFVDEAILAVTTLILASLRKPRSGQ